MRFAGETKKTITDYLDSLVSRDDKEKLREESKSSNVDQVDFEGFGTKHASLLLKRKD